MDTPHRDTRPDPTDLARRIGRLLEPALDCPVDVPRMLRDALYARDVLLVCEAHRDSELAALAHQYRQALAPPPVSAAVPAAAAAVAAAPAAPPRPTPAGRAARQAAAHDTLRAAPAVRPRLPPLAAGPAEDAGESTIARAMRQQPAAAAASTPPGSDLTADTTSPPPRDSGLSSFFDRFRSSAPASLPPGRGRAAPLTLGPDGPDTWPPEAEAPLDGALRAQPTRPPAQTGAPGKTRPGKGWLSPSRWFSRGSG